jgi:isopentenyl-diphosphate delta-isomerase
VRQSRKLDHIKYSLQLPDGPLPNGFEDISLVHNCLPDIAWKEIHLTGTIGGMSYHHPVVINAVTGGAQDVTEFNGRLAEVARRTKAIMAVGSQYAAIENPETKASFEIVRKKNPDGIIWANLGAHSTPRQAQQAVEMIGAQGLQIHLNAAQELIMTEGDRDLSGYLDNIRNIAQSIQVPVIIKEVGFGIAYEEVRKLSGTGIRIIDAGGAGGTNFMAIEAARKHLTLSPELAQWGIPTAISAVEIAAVAGNSQLDFMVSGGIRTPLETIKALALGGHAVGIATPVVRMITQHSTEAAVEWFEQFLHEMKVYMMLLGCSSLRELWQVPVVITGRTGEWLTRRGLNINQYAVRKKQV